MAVEIQDGKAIEDYIQQGVIRQINRVFGVQTFWSLRSDYSDATVRVRDKNSARNSQRAFIRPTDLQIRADGYRNAALGGRGMRAGTRVAGSDGLPAVVDVVHPVSINTLYTVAFEVATWSELQKLFRIWANTFSTSGLDFRLEYLSREFTIHTVLGDTLDVPDFGDGSEQTREDVTRSEGTITVQGYSTSVTDPHQVPVIRSHDLDLNPPS